MAGGPLIRYVAAALLSVFFVAPGLTSPAHAHTELDNTIPADGVSLEKTPGTVQLNFTEPIDAELSNVVVRGPDGQDLTAGPPRQSGPGLMQPIGPAARAGTVEVGYRVVSLDGHPVSGSYTFELLRGDPSVAGARQGGAAPGGADDPADDVSLVGPLLGAAAVLLLVVGGAVLAQRRRGRSAEPRAQTAPPTP